MTHSREEKVELNFDAAENHTVMDEA